MEREPKSHPDGASAEEIAREVAKELRPGDGLTRKLEEIKEEAEADEKDSSA